MSQRSDVTPPRLRRPLAPPVLLRAEPVTEHSSVTTLELFFDLVFVFALTQVTATMADRLNAQGLL